MPTSIRLPADIEKRLTALARRTHRPKAFYIRAAMESYLEDMEDVYFAEQRMEDLRTGKERLWTQEEIEAGLDLGD